MDFDNLFDVFEQPPPEEEPSAAEDTSKSEEEANENEEDTTEVSNQDDENREDNKNDKKREAEEMEVNVKKPKFPAKPHEFLRNKEKKLDPELFVSQELKNFQYSKVERVKTENECLHEVVIPPGYDYQHLVKQEGEPAMKFPFELDAFQKEAIICIENDQSVLVSAHTSAGKTVAALYSIALCLKKNQRVIYTTPIKALSNQKYREFNEEFEDVGLVTGDVTLNINASCLIMTTEILRNMLYRGSEIIKEVGWVIYDEIHYMRDKERGYVWEESLILMQNDVHFLFLSATIPNAIQFAEWVVYLHRQPCHVVCTDYRPVPLQHYVYPRGGNGIYMTVDEKSKFLEGNFNTAFSIISKATENEGSSKDSTWKRQQNASTSMANDVQNLVRMLMERKMFPIIVFSFSKKECEILAAQIARFDFTNEREKECIDEIFHNAVNVLSDEDKNLTQISSLLPLLKRGIGIHHGGLLPLLKEIVELLFGENFLKVLFATETFSMGLNMPAKTVVFTKSRKFDGKDNRYISSGEYIQMSGRAGRRGLDDKGIVIMTVDDQCNPDEIKQIMQGKADPLNSAFYLTYNTILNLIRVDGIQPEYMIQRTFYQFQHQSSILPLSKELDKYKNDLKCIKIPKEDNVAAYYECKRTLDDLSNKYRQFMTEPKYLIPFLQPGRLIKTIKDDNISDWSVILNFRKKDIRTRNPMQESTPSVMIDIIGPRVNATQSEKMTHDDVEIMEINSNDVYLLSSIRINDFTKSVIDKDTLKLVSKTLLEVKNRFGKKVPLLSAIDDMKINSRELSKIVEDITKYEQKLLSNPLHGKEELEELYTKYKQKMEVKALVAEKESRLKGIVSLLHTEELKQRKRVLKRMNYCTKDEIVEIKGKTACEIGAGDELLLTEMIFNGVFARLEVPEIISILSCFVCDERSKSTLPKQVDHLQGLLREMQETARHIARVSIEAGLNIDEDTYVDQFKPFLMDACYLWANGAKFQDVCASTDIFEGSIIRCMRRLEEMLRQLAQSARAIGNFDLQKKFSDSIVAIKRGIVFAASLYL